MTVVEACTRSHEGSGAERYCPECGLALLSGCAHCSEPRTTGRFCEACGRPYETEPPTHWTVVVAVERAAPGARQPVRSGPRIVLTGDVVRVGKSGTHDDRPPEIDLAAPVADPGVSHDHAHLLQQDDGSWVLMDRGSRNGTYLDRHRARLAPGEAVAVRDGDRVRLGLWTCITIEASWWAGDRRRE